jgi:hypothetical protein
MTPSITSGPSYAPVAGLADADSRSTLGDAELHETRVRAALEGAVPS